ncbi:NAD(P)H oxidoreductase [[Haemophilus] felis]|nr:NAD(P)H oxidoreductase [[Haemophilus] felis]
MNHLIIFAHPNGQGNEPKSLNHSILKQVILASENVGAETIVRDLYALNFQAILSQQEIQASFQGIIAVEIQQEQELIKQADLITLIYPLWWMGFPAILKGYLDRVLTYGFAYKTEGGASVGLLSSKKMQHFATLGNSYEKYENLGFIQSLQDCLVNGLFNFCGITDIQQCFFGEVYAKNNEEIAQLLQQVFAQTQQNLISLVESVNE